MRLSIVVLLLAGSTAVSTQRPPIRPPTFRSEISYVEVPVRVLDKHGEFVRGLTQADFRVLENGRPQAIAKFQAVDVPLFATNPPKVGEPPQIDANVTIQGDSRVYLFIIDDLFLEASHTLKVRNLVRRFILDKFGSNDVGAVALMSGNRVHEFTRDRGVLIGAVEQVVGSYDPTTDRPFRHPMLNRARLTVMNLSRWLGATKDRQKTLVVVSPEPLCVVMSDATRKLRDDGEPVSCAMMFDAAVQAGVRIYAIDPRGPAAPRCAMAEWSGEGCLGSTVGGAVQVWSSPQFGARTLAEETGGFAAVMTNGFDAIFDRIVRENSAYYVIGYYSTNDRADGKFRSHDIKVSRRDVRVISRSGYLAPDSRRE
jgi:VWFA-related protein